MIFHWGNFNKITGRGKYVTTPCSIVLKREKIINNFTTRGDIFYIHFAH